MNRVSTQGTARRAAPTPKRKPGTAEKPQSQPMISGQERERMIAEAAYYRALSRGFQSGYELADWLDAEREIDTHLLG